jgi:hypothetical protein
VTSTAGIDEIRRAYRDRAREHHPDATGARSAGAMAAVNEAWFVLSDPGRRAVYDASQRSRSVATPAAAAPDDDDGDLDELDGFVPMRHGVARFGIPLPWILALVALTVIFVFTAYAVRPKSGTEKPDGVLQVGSCVTVAAPGAVTETGCDQPHEGRVVAMPSGGLYCVDGDEAYADGRSSRVICVRRG